MSPSRPLAALTAAGLAAAGAVLAAPHLLPANAAPAPDPVRAVVAATHRPPLIEGVVTDQLGREVDDVSVEATRGHAATPSASALTYASDQEGGPQHGYFFLEVGKKGSYTVTLSKRGYRTETYGPIRIRRLGQTVDLGEVEIVRLYSTTTSASLERRVVTTRQHGIVDVRVRTSATKRPTGVVVVREGRHVIGRDAVRRGDRGAVTVALPRLPMGNHVLRAYFLGNDDGLRPSSSPGLTLVEKKGRR